MPPFKNTSWIKVLLVVISTTIAQPVQSRLAFTHMLMTYNNILLIHLISMNAVCLKITIGKAFKLT